MKYTYKNIKDKTKSGLNAELSSGLVKVAFYFETTMGIPLEIFESMLQEKAPTKADQWLLYMNFRNMHPELFN